MQLDNLQGQHQFHIRQRLRMMVNQYEVRAVSPTAPRVSCWRSRSRSGSPSRSR